VVGVVFCNMNQGDQNGTPSEPDGDEFEKPDDVIRRQILDLTRELHKRGHTRKEIVSRLRSVADDYEDHFGDSDSWDKAPHEKDVVLPGDYDE
jgi:hypothetical protein